MKIDTATVLLFAFFLVLFHQASALKCLKCFSYKSTDDCKTRMGSVTCDEGYDRCSNSTVEVYVEFMKETIVGYQLDCAKHKECEEKWCRRHFGIEMGIPEYKKCVISCCQNNLCPYNPNTTTLRPPSDDVDEGGPAKGARGGVEGVQICCSLWGIILGVTFFMIFSN